ncbi:hypothetical protein ABZ772_35700, partial [Streptomyces griseoincarnatus]
PNELPESASGRRDHVFTPARRSPTGTRRTDLLFPPLVKIEWESSRRWHFPVLSLAGHEAQPPGLQRESIMEMQHAFEGSMAANELPARGQDE